MVRVLNTGIHSGLLTRIKNEHSWILTIHYVNHMAELAKKDALLQNEDIKAVDTFIQDKYYLHKQSGKLRRMDNNACVAFGIDPTHFLGPMVPDSSPIDYGV